MATVQQVATAALRKILVQASEAELEPDEYQDFIFAMNNFMAALDVDGISLGYTAVENLGDIVTIPSGALRGLIDNMAVESAPDYDGVVTPALAVAAAEGIKTMRLIGSTVPTSYYPDTLPRGSGNDNSTWMYDRFYHSSEADILAETNGAIALEDNTE
jgi:hypothetical protein